MSRQSTHESDGEAGSFLNGATYKRVPCSPLKVFLQEWRTIPQKPLKCTSCPHQISQALGWGWGGGGLKKVPQAMHSRQFYKFLRGWHTMTGRGGRGQCWEIIPSISDPLMTGKLRWPGAHAAPRVNWASNGGKLLHVFHGSKFLIDL